MSVVRRCRSRRAEREERKRGEEVERVKKRILLPEKTSVKEGKKERKRERWMNDDTNVQRTVFFAAAQKPRASEKEGGWAKFAVSETNETAAALSSFMM